MRSNATSAARASGQTRRAEGSERRKSIQRPDPPTAMVRRRDERPLIAIRVNHERLDAPALVLRLAQPRDVVLLQSRGERVHVGQGEVRDHADAFWLTHLLEAPRLTAQRDAEVA